MELSLSVIVSVLIGCVLANLILRGLYNLFWHPLAKFPGPLLASAFEFPYLWDQYRGVSTHRVKQHHDKYGAVVRISPTTLSFNSAGAWKDILTTKHNGQSVPKDLEWFVDHDDKIHIMTANDVEHARIRKSVSHAFSESALKEQEPLLQKRADLLIQRMHESSGLAVNMKDWFDYYTFDTVGELALGEDFQALEHGKYHFWIEDIFTGLRMWPLLRIGEVYKTVGAVFNFLISLSPHYSEKRDAFFKLPVDKIERRLASKTNAKDFLSFIRQDHERGLIGKTEMIQTLCVFITGGSETTGTCLSGLLYFVLANRDVLANLEKEMRSTFKGESEIRLEPLTRMKYLDACIQETLRMYPPASAIYPRKTNQYTTIDGQVVPPGTTVGVHQYATYRSARNFANPDEFVPERWLAEEERPAVYKHDDHASFHPFHMGPRGCIGRNLALLEIRLAMMRLLWNFNMELSNTADDWIDQKVYLVWNRKDLMVRMTPRQKG